MKKMINGDILSPETWPIYHEQCAPFGDVATLSYSQGTSDFAEIVKNLPADLTAEEFKEEILKLCVRAEVLSNDVVEKLSEIPWWPKPQP
jgi:hypothetical protein